MTFLNAQRAHRSPAPGETSWECDVQLWFVLFMVAYKSSASYLFISDPDFQFSNKKKCQSLPLKKIPSRSCNSIAEGTHLPVVILYLSRVYRHLLRSHYYVWLNNCSHFNYIPFNLVIMWVSEIASTSSVYSFHACWNYLMLQIQMSVERTWEYWESSKTLKSQLHILRIILCKRCFLLSHLSMSVGEGWQPASQAPEEMCESENDVIYWLRWNKTSSFYKDYTW